jgi:hypothetical protein
VLIARVGEASPYIIQSIRRVSDSRLYAWREEERYERALQNIDGMG